MFYARVKAYILVSLVLCLTWIAMVMPSLGLTISMRKLTPNDHVSISSPCSKAKNSITIKLCQLFKLQYHATRAFLYNTLFLLTSIFAFIYILGLITNGIMSDIFKPPRFYSYTR